MHSHRGADDRSLGVLIIEPEGFVEERSGLASSTQHTSGPYTGLFAVPSKHRSSSAVQFCFYAMVSTPLHYSVTEAEADDIKTFLLVYRTHGVSRARLERSGLSPCRRQ